MKNVKIYEEYLMKSPYDKFLDIVNDEEIGNNDYLNKNVGDKFNDFEDNHLIINIIERLNDLNIENLVNIRTLGDLMYKDTNELAEIDTTLQMFIRNMEAMNRYFKNK